MVSTAYIGERSPEKFRLLRISPRKWYQPPTLAKGLRSGGPSSKGTILGTYQPPTLAKGLRRFSRFNRVSIFRYQPPTLAKGLRRVDQKYCYKYQHVTT